ncbi:MAG TPA: patatin-like phospholipase family protein [Gallionella sp.]
MKKLASALLLLLATAACTGTKVTAPPQLSADRPPARIALALGGGAARGFAHIGVIKALEAQGISADIVVGTSAGSVVGALYAGGLNGFQIQEISMRMEASQILDGSGFYQCMIETMISDKRGCIKGQALQMFINNNIGGRPIEKLDRTFAAVATNLGNGEMVVFRSGDTGMAVRASSSVPVFFQPVTINGKDYVDGGLVAPVPSSVARSLGADFVIAVDISDRPEDRRTAGITDILWQTFSIFGKTINRHEQSSADLVIRPVTSGLPSSDASGSNRAVLEGEKAVAAVLPELKAMLAKLNEQKHVTGMP